jgi:tetratricopeptide (TPR) repeat protein
MLIDNSEQDRDSRFRPRVFLSSCFRDDKGGILPIRERLIKDFDLARGVSPSMWVGERFEYLKPEHENNATPVQKALFCMEGVKRTDCFVALLADRHGSSIDAFERSSIVSFFEIELFSCALFQKPTYLYAHPEYHMEEKLKDVLALLRPAIGVHDDTMSEADIVARISGLAEPSIFSRMRASLSNGAIGRFVRILAQRRHEPYRVGEGTPTLRFLNGGIDDGSGSPDFGNARVFLEAAKAESNAEHKLALLWLCLRELSGTPPAGDTEEQAHLKDAAYSRWNSAAAWYGLHAHIHMGGLAALSEVSRLRDEQPSVGPAPDGALSSAYYSIAAKTDDRLQSRDFLDLAKSHAERAQSLNPSTNNTLLLGSILARQGRGADAVEHFRQAYDRSENLERGVAASEYGFAMIRHGDRTDRRHALELLIEGVEKLEEHPEKGFRVRARRKLAMGYLKTGKGMSAATHLALAYKDATAHGLFDQIGKIERIAGWLDDKTGSRLSAREMTTS